MYFWDVYESEFLTEEDSKEFRRRIANVIQVRDNQMFIEAIRTDSTQNFLNTSKSRGIAWSLLPRNVSNRRVLRVRSTS
jgi:hypothetical protein